MTSRDTMMNDKRTLRDDLIAAKALIDTPEKWRKDSSDNHTSCCAILATNRIAGGMNEAKAAGLWLALYNALPLTGKYAQAVRGHQDWSGVVVGDFNDDDATTHADIMALFQRAIDAASEEGR